VSLGDDLGRGFGRVWFATGATALGAQVAQLAVPLLAVVSLHASSGQVGLLGAAQWVPFLLVALPVGVLIDRHRRRPMLIAAEWIRVIGTSATILLGATGVLTLPTLLLLAAVVGCGAVMFEVAYQSFLPSVVPWERLDAANSRLQATEATALVAGPGVGGLLVQLVGALPTLAVTAVGSLMSALSLSRIPESFAPATRRKEPIARDLLEGLRFLRRDRVLAGLLGFSAISNPFAQWITLLFLVDGVRRLHLTTGQVGLVLAIGAVGTLLGAATAPAVARRLGVLRTIVITAAVDPLVLYVLPAAVPGWGVSALVTALGAAFAVNGYAVGLDTVLVTTVRQTRTPDELRGRVNAATRMISYGTIALGAAIGGLVGQLLGVRLALLIGCLGALTTLAWVAGWAALLRRRHEGLDGTSTVPVEQRASPCYRGLGDGVVALPAGVDAPGFDCDEQRDAGDDAAEDFEGGVEAEPGDGEAGYHGWQRERGVGHEVERCHDRCAVLGRDDSDELPQAAEERDAEPEAGCQRAEDEQGARAGRRGDHDQHHACRQGQ
jgi:MFS family permease